jgi:hypothetical protein
MTDNGLREREKQEYQISCTTKQVLNFPSWWLCCTFVFAHFATMADC